MFSAAEYLVFCLGAFALIVSPGPDFVYVASRGLSGDRKSGVVAALGIGCGLAFHTLLAVSGVTLVLLTSNLMFNIVKWAGAAYLIWLAFQLLRSGGANAILKAKTRAPLSIVWRQGVLTNVLNPKVALTFAAFLPPFVHPARGGAALQIAVLGATLCVLATLWFCVVGAGAGSLGRFLVRYPRVERAIQIFAGVVLGALGVRLAFATR